MLPCPVYKPFEESSFVLEDELAIDIGVSKRLNDLAKILEQSPLLE